MPAYLTVLLLDGVGWHVVVCYILLSRRGMAAHNDLSLTCVHAELYPSRCVQMSCLAVCARAGMKRRRVSNACIFAMPCQKDGCYAAGVAAGCFVYITTRSLLVTCYFG
jgi:hypothetical protein